MTMRKWLWVLGMVTLLGACSKKEEVPFNNVDITGATYAREFSLTDHTGAHRTLADYRGKVVALFFGFTQCPDICPTTLQELAAVKKELGADGDKLQVLFVTLDPERDTPAVLAKYMANFDPSFIGLVGNAEETAKFTREFKILVQKVPGQTETSYTLNHSTGTYVFDHEGRVRLFVSQASEPAAVLADLKRLLKS